MDLWLYHAGWALGLLLVVRLVVGLITARSYNRRHNVKTMVVLGSGGHTAEMLALLRGFDLRTYQPRCYVVAATDAMSGNKAAAFEAEVAAAEAAPDAADLASKAPERQHPQQQQLRRSPRKTAAGVPPAPAVPPCPERSAAPRQQAAHATPKQQYSSTVIPRSREVGQPWLSSAVSTARALWCALALVCRQQPDLVLVNGPGTCIPICAAACLARVLGVAQGRVVYVESIARVYRLSLSGKILYHSRMASSFFVQWEELVGQYPRATYAGRLM